MNYLKQKQLKEFYDTKFCNENIKSFGSEFFMPLLMDVTNLNTDIMIVGQEADKWGKKVLDKFKTDGIDFAFKFYVDFINNKGERKMVHFGNMSNI